MNLHFSNMKSLFTAYREGSLPLRWAQFLSFSSSSARKAREVDSALRCPG